MHKSVGTEDISTQTPYIAISHALLQILQMHRSNSVSIELKWRKYGDVDFFSQNNIMISSDLVVWPRLPYGI